jgi:hypothetical protein
MLDAHGLRKVSNFFQSSIFSRGVHEVRGFDMPASEKAAP